MIRLISCFLLLCFALSVNADGVDDSSFYGDQCAIVIPSEKSVNHYQFFDDYPECYPDIFNGYKGMYLRPKHRVQYWSGQDVMPENITPKTIPEPPTLPLLLAYMLCIIIVLCAQKRTTRVASSLKK